MVQSIQVLAVLAGKRMFALMDAPPAIYAEAEVPAYSLPSLGSRSAMLDALADHEYGRIPDFKSAKKYTLLESGKLIGDPRIERQQWRVEFSNANGVAAFELLVFLPAGGSKPAPVFLGMNFFGNHTVHADPAIIITDSWSANSPPIGVTDNRANETGRGKRAGRWPVEMITERGYGLATLYCGDIAPDDAAHWRDGVARLWTAPDWSRGDSPGAITSWAWGLSRAREALAANPLVDAGRIAVIGHSRLGKAALWAGAMDDSFALVISNESGCGGAALSRRRIGERLVNINTRFPHWFAPAFSDYNEREHDLPIDQHQLLAAVAPRPLYVASAEGDRWADPRGEYLALAAAAKAWNQELPGEPPDTGEGRVSGSLGYHCRPGEHDLTPGDWEHFLDFAGTVMSNVK